VTVIASGPGGDFALGDVAADVVFGPIGVERDLGMIKDTRRSSRLAWIPLSRRASMTDFVPTKDTNRYQVRDARKFMTKLGVPP
jgi:hypothetical protein